MHKHLHPHGENLMAYRLTIVFCIALLTTFANVPSAFATFPNIVYILADDMGTGDVSILNPNSKIPTPHIDSLGREGIRFTNAHAACSVCTPTRYGIITGRYPMRTATKSGVLNGYAPCLFTHEPDRLTLPQMLKEKGYNTAVFGKWHLGITWTTKDGNPIEPFRSNLNNVEYAQRIDFTKPIIQGPLTTGFDRFFGISASLDMHPYVFIDNDRVTELPTAIKYNFPRRPGPAGENFEPIDVQPTLTRKVIEFIEEHAVGKNANPFFVYMPLASPHTPVVPTEEWQGKNELGEYGDFCMQVDSDVGEILAALERSGLSENTIVIFTADNGFAPILGPRNFESLGHFPSHIYRGYKADIYEGGTRVPFLIRWPAGIKEPDRACNHLVSLNDLMRTLAEIIDYTLPDNAAEDSFSMLPLFAGEFAETSRKQLVTISQNNRVAFRDRNWKLIVSAHTQLNPVPRNFRPMLELYDLAVDPGEQHNLAAARQDRVALMLKSLQETFDRGRSTPGAPQQNNSDFRLLIP